MKTKGIAELTESLAAEREKLSKLQFDLSVGKVKNIREIREIKKSIARLLTLIKQQKTQK